eukprot:jgi/Undpi1/2981/HiC_scaffold_14.g06358.m1
MENPRSKGSSFVQPKVIEKLDNVAVEAALKALNGSIRYRSMCSCGTSSVSSDSFELLQVPMRQSTSDDVELQSEGASTERTTEQEDDHEVMHLTDLLKQVFTTEMLDSCDKRKNHGGKTIPGAKARTPSLAKTPDQLLLRLGRYSGEHSATRRKLTNLVTIPTELDIGPQTEVGKASGAVIYDVDAVIHHLPGKKKLSTDQPSTKNATTPSDDLDNQGGHYVTCVRTSHDTWRSYNDNEVTSVSTAQALTRDVYIVSYAKRR